MTNKLSKTLFVAALSIFIFTACEKDDEEPQVKDQEQEQSIVDIAVGNPAFSILVDALVKADLVSALEAKGPFTVLAPTNEAFEALLSDLGASSLDDISKEALTPILLYHVISGEVKSTDLTDGYVPTLSPGPNSTYVTTKVDAMKAMFNGSQVTQPDIEASNGVIHVIDKVLLPTSVVDIAINNPNFSILVEAVVKAELVETLNGEGPFTVFAPTNEAFQALFTSLNISGISDLTKEQLIPILQYHVVSGNVRSTDLSSGDVPTLNGDISIDVKTTVTINSDVNVVAADVQGKNGVIHVIDKVLLP